MTTWRSISVKIRWLEDKLCISPKLIYFTISSVFYALYLFRAKFIENYLGLTSREYGDISAIMAIFSFAFMTLWSSMADGLGRHRLVLGFLCIMITVSVELALFVAKVDNHTTRFYLTAGMMSMYALFGSGIPPLMDFITLKMLSNREGFSRDLYGRQRLWGTISYGFITLVVGRMNKQIGIESLFYVMPICSMASVLVLVLLAPADEPKSLRQMLRRNSQGGDLKDDIPAEPFKSRTQSPIKPSHYDYSIGKANSLHLPSPLGDKTASWAGSVKSAPVSPGGKVEDLLPAPTAGQEDKLTYDIPTVDASTSTTKKGRKRPIVRLLTNPNYLFMLLVVFMSGSARAVMTTFLSKYWLNDMKLTDFNASLAANFGILMEIVIFFFGPWLIGTFGIYWMLIFAQLAAVMRVWAYVLLPATSKNYWMVYLIELLKGVAFGFTQSAGVKLAADCAPVGLEATAQALYTSVYSQLPAVITAFVGGRVYGIYGAGLLFLVTAIISTAALVLFVVKYLFDGSIRLPFFRRPLPVVVTTHGQAQSGFDDKDSTMETTEKPLVKV